MLSPVREDTLAFHTNRLKWMGYPFAVLLAINLTCVLYAVSRTSSEGELPARTLAAIDPDPAQAPPVVFSQAVAQPTPADSEAHVSEKTSQIVEGIRQSALRPAETDTESTAPMASQAWRWLPQWLDRLPTWEAEGNHDNRVLPDDRDEDSIVPDITVDSPKPEPTPKITTQPPSPIYPENKVVVTPREQPGLVVRNPASTGGAVAFLANGNQVALKPGETKFFDEDKQITILFHRGGSFGNATYILTNGQYHFAVTKDGWSLLEDQTSDAH